MEGSYCPECGSWERECSSETPVDGCICQRCARVTIARLTRERDEARKQASAFARAAAEARETAYNLRALLRDIYENGYDWSASQRRDMDARIKAALEG